MAETLEIAETCTKHPGKGCKINHHYSIFSGLQTGPPNYVQDEINRRILGGKGSSNKSIAHVAKLLGKTESWVKVKMLRLKRKIEAELIKSGNTPPISIDIWSTYESFRHNYPKLLVSNAIRPERVRNSSDGEQRKPKPQNEQRRFPELAVQVEADKLGRIDPVTDLKEDTPVKNKYTGVIQFIKFVGDHIIPWNGYNTTPENLQAISNVANSIKKRTRMTHEEIRKIFYEDYVVLVIPDDEIEILRKWQRI